MASTDADRQAAIDVQNVSFAYGARQALVDLSLTVGPAEIFAILGPNGGGKTTLFRLLSTLIPLQSGQISILGRDLAREASAIRSLIGVVFQAPSLDRKLTAAENVRLQGALYGLGGEVLRRRSEDLLARFGIADRAGERTEKLSGGQKRRVELAKGMVHGPRLLLLDEPSTGLDPAARMELRRYLQQIREEGQVTVVLTTHFLDEAEAADRVAILDQGRLVALGTPAELRAGAKGDSLTLEARDAAELAGDIQRQLGLECRVIDGAVRCEIADAHQWIPRLFDALPGRITAVRLGKPTLEDVFIARTGRRFSSEPLSEGSSP